LQHGKPTTVTISAAAASESEEGAQAASRWGIFEGLPERFTVGRYHSLFGQCSNFPPALRVTAVVEPVDEDARNKQGIPDEAHPQLVMGVEHRNLPIAAVQFHPESILTSPEHGMRLLANALLHLHY
jgi:anthranilate synthase